jgi:hypothetical protein
MLFPGNVFFGLLSALRQRCEVAAVVTQPRLERGRSVCPGFIRLIHMPVQAGEEEGFAGAANVEPLSRMRRR